MTPQYFRHQAATSLGAEVLRSPLGDTEARLQVRNVRDFGSDGVAAWEARFFAFRPGSDGLDWVRWLAERRLLDDGLNWQNSYRTALERAICRTEQAKRDERTDRLWVYDQSRPRRGLRSACRGAVVCWADGRAAELRQVTRANSVVDLLAGIAQCVADGSGCDLPIRDLAVQEWLLDRVEGRVQIGGTGAQAAATLATLGFPVLLHSTGRSRNRSRVCRTGRKSLSPDRRVWPPLRR